MTPATDIYALGAVAYHCLAGQPPFPGDNPIAVALQHLSDDPPPLPAGIPAPVRAVVATAMAKDPADRFPDADAMAEAAQRSVGMTGVAQTAVAQTAVAQTGVAQTVAAPTAITTMTAASPTELLDATAAIGPPAARRRFPHGALACSTTALALVAMVVLLLQPQMALTPPDTPTEPLPGQSETVGPGVPVGDNDVGDSTPTGSPEPTGQPVPSRGAASWMDASRGTGDQATHRSPGRPRPRRRPWPRTARPASRRPRRAPRRPEWRPRRPAGTPR